MTTMTDRMTDSGLELTRELWDVIGTRLREPFDPMDVDFRVQGRANEQTGRAQVVAYIDGRAVQDRLDRVVGPGNWAFDWQPIVIDKGEVMVAKGTLTIFGVSKSDAGSASNFEQSLGAVTHCFKRAAYHWGIGRYLKALDMAWVNVEKGGRIPAEVLRELRGKLPRSSPRRAETMNAPVAATARDDNDDDGITFTTDEASTAPAAPDTAGEIVDAKRQDTLTRRIRDELQFKTEGQVNHWLDQHVRSTDDPRGALLIGQMRIGKAHITEAEYTAAIERLDQVQQRAAAKAERAAMAGGVR